MTHIQMVNDSEELGDDEGHIGHIRLRRQCKALRETYVEIMGSKSDPTRYYIWQEFPDEMVNITPITLSIIWRNTTPSGQPSLPTTTK